MKYLINKALIKPFGLNLIRVAVTAILLWIIYLFGERKTYLNKQDLGRFLLCALTGIAINQLLFIKGLSLTYSIHASLLMLITPILITLFATWVLNEQLNNNKIAGLILGAAGATILVAAGNKPGNANDILLGDIFIIINAVSYTVYFILVKPLMHAYKPVAVIRIIFTIGFFIILPFCWNEFARIPWTDYSAGDYGTLSLIVIGGTFFAYFFNVYGIKVLGASVAGTYIYSQPFFAAAIAFIFLGEDLSLYKIIAAVFIFSGVYFTNKRVNAGEN